MIRSAPVVMAEPFTTLPVALRHRGEPSRWARMTRPGHSMHSFLDGSFFDSEDHLWVSDVPYGRVFRVTPTGQWQVMHHYDGEPHAMRIAPDGRHIIADYSGGLVAIGDDNSIASLHRGLPEQPFLGLSDMAYTADGTLWLTDSGRTSLSDRSGRVYCLKPDGTLHLLLDCVPYPNGIAPTPDGTQIYVAATRANQIWRFAADLPENGTPMVGTFLQLSGGLGPDGLASNEYGWLAVAQAQAGRAYVFTALGDAIAEVRLPRGLWTTCVAFHPVRPERLYIVDAQYGAVFTADIPDQRTPT
ncbi:MAG: SMP-30/gluconolactonase/LRE family protein [Alphaproteobacteria bacterium]|nr:SMP-30/gluconolactonase/LRE family protein [Alphaproteobacteria bacterium]